MDALTPVLRRSPAGGEPCPFLDRGDPRCGRRFTLDRIDEAFAVCFNAHHGCEQFHRLRRQDLEDRVGGGSGGRVPAILKISAHGPTEPRRIRPTGS
jgi:hypothetical protein